MESQKDQIVERLKQATNVLVTVSANPSVDQLAGAMGLTLLLNKLGKHATAVFSGKVPSTLEFLQPEKTLESTTDSLRDFIIALDKSKADKLRYKVEDQMVKIFITPYRTSITDKDLEFSQGDFNVEVVLAVGVKEQEDLDQAISSHGRILHDATVVSVATEDGASLGSINWVMPGASSLSEMLLDLGLSLKADALDGQIATAFLTGIVAQTDRFSNEKTTAETMQLSAKLMAAGANQQLIASQLGSSQPSAPAAEKPGVEPAVTPSVEPDKPSETKPAEEPKSADGSLEIDHDGKKTAEDDTESEETKDEESEEEQLEQIHIDKEGIIKPADEVDEAAEKPGPELPNPVEDDQKPGFGADSPHMVTEPPALGGTLTANSATEAPSPSTDPLGVSSPTTPLLSHNSPLTPPSPNPLLTSTKSGMDYVVTPPPTLQPLSPLQPPTSDTTPIETPAPAPVVEPTSTLADLESSVNSPHIQPTPAPTASTPTMPATDHVDAARDAVKDAVVGTTPLVVEPVQALPTQPMDLNLGDVPAVTPTPESAFDAPGGLVIPPAPVDVSPNAVVTSDPGLPPGVGTPSPATPTDNEDTVIVNPTSPPPVPPPIIPPAMPPADNNPGATAL